MNYPHFFHRKSLAAGVVLSAIVLAVGASLMLAAGGAAYGAEYAAAGDEGPRRGFTPRQWEIYHELTTSRPQAGPGGALAVPTEKETAVPAPDLPASARDSDAAWMISTWDTDSGLRGIVALAEGKGNAAACFQRLEELYPAEKERLAGDDAAQTAGVDALLEAAEMAESRMIPEYYPEFVSPESIQPDFQILREYLSALIQRGEQAVERGDFLEAERCYRAGLLCGRHLTRERPSTVVYVTGIIFKMRSIQAMLKYLDRSGDIVRSEYARRYAEDLSRLMRAFVWKSNVALGELDDFACLPAAMRIALKDAEPFWRKEAVVRLATLRWGVPDSGGTLVRRNPRMEEQADRALERVVNRDPDASVRAFALWAIRNVRPDNFATMRHEYVPEEALAHD